MAVTIDVLSLFIVGLQIKKKNRKQLFGKNRMLRGEISSKPYFQPTTVVDLLPLPVVIL